MTVMSAIFAQGVRREMSAIRPPVPKSRLFAYS